jgi:hypothetical protein
MLVSLSLGRLYHIKTLSGMQITAQINTGIAVFHGMGVSPQPDIISLFTLNF